MSSSPPVPDSERGFKLLLAILGAGTVVLLLLWAIDFSRKERSSLQHWLPFLAKNPQVGEAVFRDKGCIHCHSMHRVGGTSAPDLGYGKSDGASLAKLVSAMWNHAPQMQRAMEAEGLEYPKLTYEQTSELVSFLYMSRHVDPPGNDQRGQEVFHNKGCARCHAIRGQGGRSARDLASLPLESHVEWTQSILDSSAEMKASMDQMGMAWPHFARGEFNDLLAYLDRINLPAKPAPVRKGDANAGWEVFQGKSCLVCHSVKDERGRLGPSIGPSSRVAGTFSEMAASMWNATPKMVSAMAARRIPSAHFKNNEIADLFAFVYTLRYFEPSGSAQLGQNVFHSRGCARCHGEDGLGATAPAIRGRTRLYNSISLASELWTHGRKMSDQARQAQQPWPTLEEGDIGDLLAFLNQPPSKRP